MVGGAPASDGRGGGGTERGATGGRLWGGETEERERIWDFIFGFL